MSRGLISTSGWRRGPRRSGLLEGLDRDEQVHHRDVAVVQPGVAPVDQEVEVAKLDAHSVLGLDKGTGKEAVLIKADRPSVGLVQVDEELVPDCPAPARLLAEEEAGAAEDAQALADSVDAIAEALLQADAALQGHGLDLPVGDELLPDSVLEAGRVGGVVDEAGDERVAAPEGEAVAYVVAESRADDGEEGGAPGPLVQIEPELEAVGLVRLLEVHPQPLTEPGAGIIGVRHRNMRERAQEGTAEELASKKSTGHEHSKAGLDGK